jgi:hypothetical protein
MFCLSSRIESRRLARKRSRLMTAMLILTRRALQNDGRRLALQETHSEHHQNSGGRQPNDKAHPESRRTHPINHQIG